MRNPGQPKKSQGRTKKLPNTKYPEKTDATTREQIYITPRKKSIMEEMNNGNLRNSNNLACQFNNRMKFTTIRK